ncbi:MAG: phosphatidate cytidylyltransferase [Armatimonadetes bacterium]|nr:phosphatidate cytidylyltransferase [Armatimonadota bacterium]
MLTRILTALVAIPLALFVILTPLSWPLLAVFAAILVSGGLEIARLLNSRGLIPLALGGSLVAVAAIKAPLELVPSLILGGWAIGTIGLACNLQARWVRSALLGAWLGSGLLACYALHDLVPVEFLGYGNGLVLAVIPLWVGDSAAYFVGKAVGRRLLAPKISPSKTVEGSVANLIGCLIAAFAIGRYSGLPWSVSLAFGLSTGLFGQVGDLLQSKLKRDAGVKDSGGLLPGHGGILDRLDSLLYSAPISLWCAILFASSMFHVKP